MASVRNERETFEQLINPLAKYKFNLDLSENATLKTCLDLLKDLIQMETYLKRKDIHPVMKNVQALLTRHSKVILPNLGFATEYVLKQLPVDQFFCEKILEKIHYISHSTSSSFRFALVAVFVYQCTELWSIKNTIKAALNVVTDEEVKERFALIEQNIARLKEIADEVGQMIQLYEQYDADEHAREQLWRGITSLLEEATIHKYKQTTETITDLRGKITTQKEQLEQSKSKLGAISALSSFGMLTILALDLIPIVGAITAAASAISLAASAAMAMDIKKKLNQINQYLEQLNQYENELEVVMQRIREQERWLSAHRQLIS